MTERSLVPEYPSATPEITAQMLFRKFGVNFEDRELASYPSIHLSPNAKITDYAEQIVEAEPNWSMAQDRRPKVFISVIDENIGNLIAGSTPQDIDQAKEILLDYGKALTDGVVERGEYGALQCWSYKLGVLADLQVNRGNKDAKRIVRYTANPSDDESPYSNVQFWQDIYLETVQKCSAEFSIASYVLRPNIEEKDPSVLMEFVERMQNEPLEAMLPGSSLINGRDPSKLVRIAYDSFQYVVDEAKLAGWTNAGAVQKLFDKAPKRQIPLHSIMIMVGNNIAEIIKKNKIEAKGLKADKQSIYDLENLPEAINRCLYLMFELGKKPTDSDPLNYIITGQIIGALGPAANRLIRR